MFGAGEVGAGDVAGLGLAGSGDTGLGLGLGETAGLGLGQGDGDTVALPLVFDGVAAASRAAAVAGRTRRVTGSETYGSRIMHGAAPS